MSEDVEELMPLATIAFMQDMTKEMKKFRKNAFIQSRQFSIAIVASATILAAAIATKK